MPDVVDLAACAGVPIEQVGGKARGLGRLLEHALDVPSGFVVTTDAYRRWIDAHGFAEQIGRLVSGADDVVATHAAAREVEKLLTAAGLQSEEIDRAYAQLDRVANPPVAVRSSATAEDGAEASFAGQQDTHLWIRERTPCAGTSWAVGRVSSPRLRSCIGSGSDCVQTRFRWPSWSSAWFRRTPRE